MGTVYRAVDPIIGRPVAVKVIRMLGYNDGDEQTWLRARLFQEARAAGSLCHSSIVTIYQVGEDHDVAYIAMEFVDGPTLAEIMMRPGPPDLGMLCRILNESAAALDFAHRRGVVHRDIKPANIMTTASGATKVTDFGIAKTMLGQTATKTGLVLGTPFYMSPEQIRGNPLDGRSDQFALAAIAYEIFTGRRPFQADQMTSVCYQVLHEEPISPEDLNPEISGQMAGVIKRGLAKDSEARYATCTEFTQALTTGYLTEFKRHTAESTVAPSLLPIPDQARVQSDPQPVAHQTEFGRQANEGNDAPPPIPDQGADSHVQSDHWSDVNRRYTMLMLSVIVAIIAMVGYLALRNSSPRHQSDESVEARHSGSEGWLSANGMNASPITHGKSPLRESLRPEIGKSIVSAKTTALSDKRPSQEPIARQAIVRPSHGVIGWNGHLAAGGLLVFTGSQASSGSVLGAFPDGPFRVEVYPAERDYKRAYGFH